jgi:hypothetical protein
MRLLHGDYAHRARHQSVSGYLCHFVGSTFTRGDVLLLPPVIGACLCRAHGAVNLLEISLPEGT